MLNHSVFQREVCRISATLYTKSSHITNTLHYKYSILEIDPKPTQSCQDRQAQEASWRSWKRRWSASPQDQLRQVPSRILRKGEFSRYFRNYIPDCTVLIRCADLHRTFFNRNVQVGMRNFHVHPNNSNLYQPGVNLDKLWSLVSEQVLFPKIPTASITCCSFRLGSSMPE